MTNDIPHPDRLAIVAAQIIHVRYTGNMLGPGNGFGCAEESKLAVESGCVKLIAGLLNVSVHVETARGEKKAGGHPYYVWIEKIRS